MLLLLNLHYGEANMQAGAGGIFFLPGYKKARLPIYVKSVTLEIHPGILSSNHQAFPK